jgi:hypothetical protein
MATDPKNPHERAKRMARLIVSDLVMYHAEKIAEGIRDDTLFEVLEQELKEGREYYEKNVDPAIRAETDYLNQAIVDILIKGRGNVESKIW